MKLDSLQAPLPCCLSQVPLWSPRDKVLASLSLKGDWVLMGVLQIGSGLDCVFGGLGL